MLFGGFGRGGRVGLAATLLLAPATSAVAQTVNNPAILAASVDLSIPPDGVITILGQNLPSAPNVSLGGVPLAVLSSTSTQIVASLAGIGPQPGTYLLTVSRGSGTSVTFIVTIGAGGSAVSTILTGGTGNEQIGSRSLQDTVYLGPGASGAADASTSMQMPLPVAGTIGNLRVHLDMPLEDSDHQDRLVVTVLKNGAEELVTCTIEGEGAQDCSDTVNTATFDAGDRLSWKVFLDDVILRHRMSVSCTFTP
jgi:hypothetical protein